MNYMSLENWKCEKQGQYIGNCLYCSKKDCEYRLKEETILREALPENYEKDTELEKFWMKMD